MILQESFLINLPIMRSPSLVATPTKPQHAEKKHHRSGHLKLRIPRKIHGQMRAKKKAATWRIIAVSKSLGPGE